MEAAARSIDDRRAFLIWLGTSQVLKEPQALDILRYLLSAPENLARLRIIEDASYLRPLLVVSAAGRRQPGLLLQTVAGTLRDHRAILLYLSMTEGPVYLTPYFPRRARSRLFLSAREPAPAPASAVLGSFLLDLETARLMAEMRFATKRAEVMRLIDQSLERRDREAFTALVAILKNLPPEQDLIAAERMKSG
ncbi:MAG: YpiB family protein [Bacteroidota bacterium]